MKISQAAREHLTGSVADQVKEAEIKLGYSKGTMRLYYPPESLAVLLDAAPAALAEWLSQGDGLVGTSLGTLRLTARAGRVELTVPPEGVEYVHENVPEPPFLRALIEFFRDPHHASLEALCQLFARFSPDYVCERMADGGDFQYVLYFPDGTVDPYYYCITDEMGHLTYHRFTRADYLALAE